MSPPLVTAVVPTLGRSPWLADCLTALRHQQGLQSLEIIVVDQSPTPIDLPAGLADRILRPGRNLGFAAGTNLGLAAARGTLLATVNDDAIVAPDWLSTLAATLAADPATAAAQGTNLLMPVPAGHTDSATSAARVDGCGLGWNPWWQAIQLRHGEAAGPLRPAPTPAAIEIFGVSATAALFRRTALERVAPDGRFFEPRLVSYYEDAELAGRLRAAGFRAQLAPAALALHAGSTSGRTIGRERWRLIYGNRYLAAARLLGRGFWLRLPILVARDLLDLRGLLWPKRTVTRHDPRHPELDAGVDWERLAGMTAGWRRALWLLPGFTHLGRAALPAAEIARLSRWRGQSG